MRPSKRLSRRLSGDAIDGLAQQLPASDAPHPPFGETDYDKLAPHPGDQPDRADEDGRVFCRAGSRAARNKSMAFVSSRNGIDRAETIPGAPTPTGPARPGLNMIVKTLAIDLGPRHICVLALHPGWAMTETGRARPGGGKASPGCGGVINRARPASYRQLRGRITISRCPGEGARLSLSYCKEKGRLVSQTAFPVSRQPHIDGRFQEHCTGGLSPSRILLGSRCKSGQSRTGARNRCDSLLSP